MPRVSVVIASYNSADFLEAAVRSVLAQTIDDLEVVVVDDGSTDDTPAMAEELCEDPRLKWIRQDNGGQANAKNRGIRESSAPIVGFCDADDAWHPRKLELQLPYFNGPQVGVVYSREQRFMDGPEGRVLVNGSTERPHSGRITEALFVENFVPFGTALVRRPCFEACGGFDESLRMGIDWQLWLRISLEHEFRFVDEVTYFYRVWEGQMSHDWRGRYEHAIRIMDEFLAANPDVISARARRRGWAHTYNNRGRQAASRGGEYLSGLGDALRAIRKDPAYLEAWKTIPWIARASLRSLGARWTS